MAIGLRKVIKHFESGNVCVVGLRGCGKDMLFANVVARRKAPYVSNTNYNCAKAPYLKLKFDNLDIQNNYKNFISGEVVPYDYPYPECADIYIADCGIYLPSQYCNQLNNQYPQFPCFYALSRHIANCNVHFNVQNLNRVWDKLREQSDIYIRTVSCKVIGKYVIQRVIEYDKYQSCVDRVEPYVPAKLPLMASKEVKAQLQRSNEEAKRRYAEQYGTVKSRLLIYKNKSKYDTRLFKGVLRCEK